MKLIDNEVKVKKKRGERINDEKKNNNNLIVSNDRQSTYHLYHKYLHF